MAILTKAQLEALNQSSFPDQATEAITPAILRNYNTQTIDTLVDSLDTGSFTTDAEFNAFTSSTNSSITQLNASSASQQISINALNGATSSYATSAITASSLITASVNLNTITFTKGNGTTFAVTVDTGSGGGGSVPAGTISSSAQIVGLGFLQTSSFNAYTASTDSSITQLNASSASQQISINALNAATSSYVTSAITASSLITASFSGNTLTFTKGNGTTFGVIIPDVSGSTLPSGLLSSSVTNFTDYSASVDSRINAITASGGIPAGTVSSSAQIINYGIFATTGSNTFVGNQTFTGSLFVSGNINMVNGADLVTHHVRAAGSNGLELQTSAGTNIVQMGAGGGTQAAFVGAVTANSISASTITGIGNVTDYSTSVDSRLDGLEAATSSYVTSAITASSLVTASFSGNTLTFTKGDASTFGVVIPDVSGSTIDTGSFATTGSNVFIGDETFQDASGNASTLSPYSGSIVFVAKGITSGSAGLSNITAVTSSVNLIFKSNNSFTGSLTISGSSNIINSPAAPTAGFRRQLGSNNIFLTSALPEITSSAAYVVSINNNYGNSVIRLRGAVSSSAWSFSNNIVNANLNIGNADATSANQAIAGGTISTNMLLASVNYNAYTTPLVTTATFSSNLAVGSTTLTAFSSSIQANNNIFNGNSFAVNNSYFGTASTNAAQRLALSYNVFGGINSSTLTVSGSNTTTSSNREVIGNTTNGSGIALGAVLNGDNSSLLSTLVHGSNLTVTGSTLYNTYTQAGSAFFGRNNSVNGTAARSGETVFAVGTGTSTSVRKTGFLIDSGSNTFVEGTLNVSGSTSFNGAVNITGSLTSSLTQGYVWVGDGNNVTQLVATSSFGGGSAINTGSFATTGSNAFNGNQTITGSLISSEKIQAQGINLYTGSQNGIYIGDKNNFNPATTGVPSEYSHTVIGQGALNAFLLGDRNTVVGRAALKSMTTGSDNLAFGAFAGEGLISGSSNFFMGTGAGSGVENGSNNFFLGNAAGNQFRSGSGNIIIGAAVGTQFVSGSGNLIIGQYGSKIVDNVDNQFSLTYNQNTGGRVNLFYKSGSESANLYLYGGLEIQNELRLSRGSDKPSGIVSVGSSGATVTNSLATTDSIILVTTQNSSVAGDEYPAVVSTKSAGSFTVNHNYGGTLEVGYLIINQTP